MIYKYETENGLLKKGSLFQIPFKSANGYSIKIDGRVLTEKVDYVKDGSRLWIERDISGNLFTISDNVEDEKDTLLEKISELEASLNLSNSRIAALNNALQSLQENINGFFRARRDMDEAYEELFENLNERTEQNRRAIIDVNESNTEEIETLTNLISEVENRLSKRIEEVFNTATSDYSSIRKEIAGIYDKLADNDTIASINSKYEELSSSMMKSARRAAPVPESLDKAELSEINEKYSSLKQSLAMETAQRRRADMEIKLLLERCIVSLDWLKDVIISNFGDQDFVEGVLKEIKDEFNTSLNNLARVTTANMTRAFKLKQWVKNHKEMSV